MREAVFAISALLVLASCGARSSSDVLRDPQGPERAAEVEKGAQAYATYCALCHGKDATGYAADHAPSLVNPTFLESATDDFIARGIKEGREATAMAAYARARGGPLEENEVLAIVAFLRHGRQNALPLPKKPIMGDPVAGEAVYEKSCKPCHGTRHERKDAVHLGNRNFLAAANDAFLRYAVVHGRPGTPMPSFSGVLGERDIDNVVALLRSWATPPEKERLRNPEPPPLGEIVIHPNGRHPEFAPRDNRFVPIADVKKALDEGKRIVIIDARAPSDWYSMHIPGAISVPYYSFDRLDLLPKDGTWIMAYCACPHHASGAVVDELRKRGFPKTAILDEGILEWKRRDYPVTTESAPTSPTTR